MLKNLISYDDFIDLYSKVRGKSFSNIFAKFFQSHDKRAASKWNTETQPVSSSAFCIIPKIQKQRNKACTSDANLDYSDYVVQKYIQNTGQSGLRMLSVGCGAGLEERKFAKNKKLFKQIIGLDIAKDRIDIAQQKAKEFGYSNLDYIVSSFENQDFEPNSFDVVLFHSSLHHLRNIENLLAEKVQALLKEKGLLIINEYVGPNRLQWTNAQLKEVNEALKILPKSYKERLNTKFFKKKAYRPGWLRMLMIDPSEAADSEAIIPALHRHYKVLEENKLGGNITQPLFKDIAHNFLQKDEKTDKIIANILTQEKNFLKNHSSDYIFGLHQNKS